jgi:ribosomal protein S18 acetylase RimI-like enzyme
MATGLETLHEVTADDTRPAAAVLARAFEPDPIWSKVFAGVPGEKMAIWFQGAVLYGREFGAVYATSERLEGIAGVVPGEYSVMTMRRALKAGTWKQGMKMGLQLTMRAPRMMRIFAPLDADRKEHMGEREFTYVMIVGVDPEHQGRGHASTLLRALMEDSDRTGVPLYLETETQDNRAMYEHFGFELLREITVPVVDLPMWQMLREPTS